LKFILVSYDLPIELEEKLFEIKIDSNNFVLKIVSYFPLTELEKNNMISSINQPNFVNFNSIFTDTISNIEWNRTKLQIKKRFQDEIFHIDEK
jgi:hypothetical protein